MLQCPWLGPWVCCHWCHLVFLSVTPLFPERQKVIGGGNDISPLTDSISLLLASSKLGYFLLAGFTRSCSPRPDFLVRIVLKVPTMDGRDLFFPKKRWGKKVYWRSFFTPANACPMFFVTHYKNIHSFWIAQTTMAQLSWGFFPFVLGISQMFISHVDVKYFIHWSLDFSSSIKPPR